MGPQSDSVVVVLGSLHYDILLDAPHLPRRGETVTGSRWFPKFGGKGGNQAVAALRAGAQTRLVGAVGQDAFGAFIRAHLDQVGLSPEFIATHPDLPTGMSVAISETDGDYGAVIVSGVNSQIDPARLDDPAIWRDAGILLLQNEMREDLNLAASRMARARGARVCLNAAPARALSQELAAGIDVLIVNALEAEALCRRAVTDLISAGDAARDLARRFACAIVTAGGPGWRDVPGARR